MGAPVPTGQATDEPGVDQAGREAAGDIEAVGPAAAPATKPPKAGERGPGASSTDLCRPRALNPSGSIAACRSMFGGSIAACRSMFGITPRHHPKPD